MLLTGPAIRETTFVVVRIAYTRATYGVFVLRSAVSLAIRIAALVVRRVTYTGGADEGGSALIAYAVEDRGRVTLVRRHIRAIGKFAHAYSRCNVAELVPCAIPIDKARAYCDAASAYAAGPRATDHRCVLVVTWPCSIGVSAFEVGSADGGSTNDRGILIVAIADARIEIAARVVGGIAYGGDTGRRSHKRTADTNCLCDRLVSVFRSLHPLRTSDRNDAH